MMIKNDRFLSWIFLIRRAYGSEIAIFLIPLLIGFVFIFSSSMTIYAEEMLSIDGGLGTFHVKAKDDQFQADSKNTRRHISLYLEFEKDEYPLRISFGGSFFTTDTQSEKWTSPHTHGSLYENQLDTHGFALDALGYITPYTYAFRKNIFYLKPYIGWGLTYRRVKLERKNLTGDMIPLTLDIQYLLGNQTFLEIGAMPHVGFFLEFPKSEMEFRLTFGWNFLAAKSDIDYFVSFSGNDKKRYPFQVHTSGSSILGRIQLLKNWESFSLAMELTWDKTKIDDELIPFFSTSSMDVYLPFPEFEIRQTIGEIKLKYLF